MKSLSQPRSSEDRSLVSRNFSNVPDTPTTNDPPASQTQATPSKGRTKNSISFSGEHDGAQTRSTSAELFATPRRSILKSEAYQSQSVKTPNPATSKDLPVRSLSTSRSVSFRNIRSSSELVAPTPTDSKSPRARTLPASQLIDSLTDFNKFRASPHTPQSQSHSTASRKQSMTGEPLPSLLLEENSKLQKELARLRLFSQEMDSLNKENQIEIQFLVEGKRRLGQENKHLKEKYEAVVRKTSELESQLEESERRGRGRREAVIQQQQQQREEEEEEAERQVRDEILLTKIQLETENSELKDSYEKLEREYLKLKRNVEAGNGKTPIPLLKTATAAAATAAAAQQKEIESLRDIIRCRDLQISLLCLPQSASPEFLQQFASIPHPYPLSSPETSHRKEQRAEDLCHLSDTGRDSLHLTQELSQLIADSATLSQAPPVTLVSPQLMGNHDPNANADANANVAHSEALLNDMNEVVSDLISSKLRIASLSTELDVEVMKQKLLKSRLGKYATRVSQLEVENISLYSRINSLSTETETTSESRSSWYPSWLRRYLD
jgi:hypothetical protein